jgi:hypothetical protein
MADFTGSCLKKKRNSVTWQRNVAAHVKPRKLAIYFTQVATRCCSSGHGGIRAYLTKESYGAGSTTTACCARRKNSLPRLPERRRLKRNVNSSR